MKIHLPLALRAGLKACFALVPTPALTLAAAAAAALLASPARAVDVEWDTNWGADALVDAPTTIAAADVLTNLPNGYTFLGRNGSPHLTDGVVAVELTTTAAGATDVKVIAGAGSVTDSATASEGALTADTWLAVTGGSYALLVGGSYAQNFNGGPVSNFTGDSHILLEATGAGSPTAAYIIGGIYKDGQAPTFEGNSYISVKGGQVTGSIVGGSTSAHLSTAIFRGDSGVWLYVPLASSGASLHDLPNNLVVGGSAGIANVTPALLQEGDSSVNADFSGFTPTAGVTPTMGKVLIGGAWMRAGTTSNQTGSSRVSILGNAADGSAVTFAQQVLGGSYLVGGGTSTLGGGTELQITGGNFNAYATGGNYFQTAAGRATIAGNVELVLEDATFATFVTGGSFTNSSGGESVIEGAVLMRLANSTFNGIVAAAAMVGGAGGSHTVAGGTQLEIESGTFNSPVAAGAYFHNTGGSAAISGGTQLTIEGGTFNGIVVGGSYESQRGASSSISGGTTVNVTAGTFSNALVGGSFVTAGSTVSRSVIEGDTAMTLGAGVQMNGVNARVIGGSYENTGMSDITTGNVSLTIEGGSYGGDIIGGSYITGTGGNVNIQRSGTVDIVVNGGTFTGTIYGGTYTMRGSADSVNEQGAISIVLAGGTFNGSVYAGGGVAQPGPGRSGVQSASTTVDIGNAVTLGTADAGIIVSGGVLNSNAASSVAGDRTLVLSGDAPYTNLDNVLFRDFNVVDNASDATIKITDSDMAFTKRGAGTLTIAGAASNLNSIDSFTVEQGLFDAGTAWVTHGGNGLSSITVGAGGEFRASGLTLEDGAALTLDVSDSPATGMVLVDGNGTLAVLGDGSLSLTLSGVENLFPGTSATLVTWNAASTPLSLDKVTWANKAAGMDGYQLAIAGNSLVLTVSTAGVYMAGDGQQATEREGYQNFGAYQSVAVMPGETLTLTLEGAPDEPQEGEGALVNNLIGAADSSFIVENSGSDGTAAVVILNNERQDIDPIPGGLPGDPVGADTTFAGSIAESGGDVEFVKRGAGTLTVGGTLDAHQLTAEAGSLVLEGDGSALDLLTLAGGTLELAGNGSIEALEDTAAGGALAIGPDATATLTGDSTLEAASIGGSADGAGMLQVQGSLSLADAARLEDVALVLDGGEVALGNAAANSVSALYGDGTLSGTAAALSVTGQGGGFGGTLAGTGTLTVEQGAQQDFTPAMQGVAGWDVVNKGTLAFDFDMGDGSNSSLTLGFVTLEPGSVTSFNYNSDAAADAMLSLTALTVGQGAQLLLSSSGQAELATGSTPYVIGRVTGGQAAGVLGKVELNPLDPAFLLLDADATTLAIDANGNIVLNFVRSDENKLADIADNPNSAAGAGMLWSAATAGLAGAGTDLRDLLDALGGPIDHADANRAMAAAAGAGASVLGMAFADDVERQLRAIRNRTVTMGADPRVVNEDLPYFHAWVNGEGDYRKLDSEGLLPGYELTSWGGTLGMDVDLGDSVTAGLALSALYGELEADSADRAKGDFDRYYMSAFARARSGNWLHTFVGTLGKVDAELKRHVGYGTGSYETRGKADGFGFGLLYEVGYAIPMDEDGEFVLEPVANVAWRHTGMDAYSESSSDAALRVAAKDYDAVTFGLGARAMAVVGENLYNRRSYLEARALAKLDAGDREGEADVAFLGDRAAAGSVRSAERGQVGVELGVGLTVPIGQESGSLFLDGSVELRDGSTHANGTVGYRIDF